MGQNAAAEKMLTLLDFGSCLQNPKIVGKSSACPVGVLSMLPNPPKCHIRQKTNKSLILIVRLKKGGVLLSDNVLWDGKVLNQISQKDKSTKAIVEYNKLLNNRKDMDSVILPIRDGITISRKKK